MRIIVFSVCYNQAEILPFWLRHYSAFADEISVFDERSNDGSRELLQANPKVIMREWPFNSGIDETMFLDVAYEWYPRSHPAFDWVIWADTDEFVYHPDIRSSLAKADESGFNVIETEGFNMVNDGLPKDDGRQIWEICKRGVWAPVYSKPIVFKPNVTIRWTRGKHHIEHAESPGTKSWLFSKIKLLHYRYLGYDYTLKVNQRNYDRCGLYTGDKGAAWSCSPDHRGKYLEGSPEWAQRMVECATDVI